MPIPSSPETDGDTQARPAAGGRRETEDAFRVPVRPRPSALRLLVVAVVSIIVTGLVFRVAIEVLRSLTAP